MSDLFSRKFSRHFSTVLLNILAFLSLRFMHVRMLFFVLKHKKLLTPLSKSERDGDLSA